MRHTTTARAALLALVTALFALATPRAALAQNAVITGKVTSEVGQPIDRAHVYINDLNISVPTTEQGDYTITIPAARVMGQQVNLRARALGFAPGVRLIRLTAGTQTVNFSMKQDVNRLDEIVVTGTTEGTERAKVPFSVARLSQEDLPVPALDPLRQLAGKVAGVRIAQTGGRPGSSPEVMMRGPTSINGTGRGQGPLIIVDNVIMNVGSLEELGAMDIESVEVVKGAAGASLYGTRAANGVITIKTKRGANTEGIKFNVRTEYGVSDVNSFDYGMPVNHHLPLDETGKRFCVAGSGNVAPCSRSFDWMTEVLRINNVNADTVRTGQNVQFNTPGASSGDLQNVFQANIWPGQYYNGFAQVVTPNPVTLNAVDASGKVGGVRFYVSGSFQNEQGAIKNLNGAQQRRARVNLDYDVRKDVLLQVSSLYDNGYIDLRTGGSSNGSVFGQLLRGAPAGTNYLARDTLGRPIVRGGGGSFRGTGNGGGTFLYDMENYFSDRGSQRFLGNVTTSYFPADWVTLEGTFAYDNRHQRDKSYEVKGYRTFTASTDENNGNIRFGHRSEEALNTSITSTFRRQFRPDLNAKLQLRALYDEDRLVRDSSRGDAFLVKDIYTSTNTSINKNALSSDETTKDLGYFAGTDIDFKDRYILGATFRYDGSSRFGPGNRWAPFGRVSMVWRISQEPWWNVNSSWMRDLRIRASRGTAGSTPRFNAQYETYTVTATGIQLGQAGNSKLKPETTTETEIGTDFTVLDRLGVEVTHALANTRDQILFVNTPASLGFSNQWQNAGTLQNKTWELGLNLPVLNRRDFNWSMRGTWDRTRTYITELFTPEYVSDANTLQGTGSFFHVTAAKGDSNGFRINRFGNIWGRKFYKKCTELPSAALQADCGPGKSYQINDEGWLVWVGAGNSYTDGITKNLWSTWLPGSQSPWGDRVPLYFGMPILQRPLRGQPGEGVGTSMPIGNVFPDFRFTWSNSLDYKRLSFYALLDGTIGNDVYNQGEGWGLLDFSSAQFDQAKKSVELAKPVGYGWRVGPSEGVGIGGFYDVLGPNNYVVEDASYAKIRELTVSYRVGAIRGVGGDWTVGLVGRNLATFTKYSGYDPEVGCGLQQNGTTGCGGGGSTTNGTGSGLINQVDAFDFPTLRSFTLTLSTRF